jgi:hypothetical protein
MNYANMISNIPTSLLITACIAVIILSFIILRKFAVNENKKMIEEQLFAIQNPDKIEKIKLVDRPEVCCVVTIQNKKPEIIAYGVQAVRIFDQLVLANPKLAQQS